MKLSRSRPVRALAVVLSLLATALLVFAIAFTIGGRNWIAHAVADAPNAGRSFRAEGDASPDEFRRAGADAQLRIELSQPDAVSLSVWLVEPREPPRATVLVLHGIRSDKSWLMGLATLSANAGFRAVVPDLRGHGRSSGDWLSYGVREAGDLSRLLDELRRSGRLVEPVGVVGVSYGAGVGIQLAARDARVHAVVAIAPFRSLEAIVPSYVRYYLPGVGRLVPQRFIAEGVAQAGVFGNFDPKAADTEQAIARTRAQVLLIHGTADDHIPAEHSRILHAAAPDHSELVLVEGDDHFSIAGDHSGTIATRGSAWLRRWLVH